MEKWKGTGVWVKHSKNNARRCSEPNTPFTNTIPKQSAATISTCGFESVRNLHRALVRNSYVSISNARNIERTQQCM